MSSTLRNSLFALVAGLALAGGIWWCLPAYSPPAHAFAIYEGDDALVVAEPGAGFYGIETSSRHRWSWSGGDASLVLRRLSGTGATRPVRLRMILHSLVPCNVTISYGEFVIWKGALSKPKLPVEIPAFTLTGPVAELRFTSDVPGALKPGGGDPRPLAFALYDLELLPAE